VTLIELKDVSLNLDQPNGDSIRVLDGVDLQVRKSQVTTLIGESGSGKSTLGRLILGLITPSRGEVVYFGESINQFFRWSAEKRLKSALIPQDSEASLNPQKTVFSILAEPLKRHRPELQVQNVVGRLLERVGLSPASRYFTARGYQLSGGQRQRVSLARALSLEPQVIVADEPVSGLDPSIKLDILHLLRDVVKSGKVSLVYITHDIATASIFSNSEMLVLKSGRVVERGRLGAMLTAPSSSYLRALLLSAIPPDPRKARAINLKHIIKVAEESGPE
jgi:ABC-type glutathione transport system ATPase component